MNIEEIANEAKKAALADPRRPMFETIARYVAHRTIEECIREILAAQIAAPDADIVKEKITARLRALAAGVRV